MTLRSFTRFNNLAINKSKYCWDRSWKYQISMTTKIDNLSNVVAQMTLLIKLVV